MAQREQKQEARMKFVRRAQISASEYNVILNRQRLLERRVYIDSQTDTINFPVGLGRGNKTLARTPRVGRFPVATLPTQYQDWYVEYTPQELEFLPVDTVLKGPIMSIDKLPPVLTTPDVSDFSSDSSDNEDASSCSSSDECSSCCSCCADNKRGTDNNNVNENNKLATNANETSGDGNHKQQAND